MDSTTFSDPTAVDFAAIVANIEAAFEARALQYISAQANDVMLPTVTGINPVVTIEPAGGKKAFVLMIATHTSKALTSRRA